MAATCLAADHPAKSRRRRFSLLHIIGGLTGGLLAACVVAAAELVADGVGAASEVRIGGLLTAVAFGFATLGLPGFRQVRHLAPRRQVPQGAGGFLEPGALGFAYGIGLGVGLATFAPIMAPQALAALCLAVGDTRATFLGFAAYGVSRGAAPVAAIWLQPSPSALADVIDQTFQRARIASGVLLLAAAVTSVVRVP